MILITLLMIDTEKYEKNWLNNHHWCFINKLNGKNSKEFNNYQEKEK